IQSQSGRAAISSALRYGCLGATNTQQCRPTRGGRGKSELFSKRRWQGGNAEPVWPAHCRRAVSGNWREVRYETAQATSGTGIEFLQENYGKACCSKDFGRKVPGDCRITGKGPNYIEVSWWQLYR